MLLIQTLDLTFFFFLRNNGVHVPEARFVCHVTRDVFLNCMTVSVATELSVSCSPVSIFICIFSTDVKVQLCFSQWYLKTIVLNSNSCEDVS